MGLLDDVIAATTTGPRIVSEQHDLNQIAVGEAGDLSASVQRQIASIRAGNWDAAEYGVTAEQQIAMLEKADTPEARERELLAMRQRAVRRASLDVTNGKVSVMVVGEPAWHKLGVNVAEATNSREAIALANLNWNASKRPMWVKRADGVFMESVETFAVMRDDTEEQLGTVGSKYQVIQNADGFAFLDSVIGEFGARFHTAGAIFGGTKVWMQCELPNHSFEVVAGDQVQAFATFTNPHDASGKAWCYPTTNRIVCANTFRTASRDRSKGLGIRHTGEVKSAIAEARRTLGLAIREIDQFKESAQVMVNTQIQPEPFFENVLDLVCKVTAADALAGADALAAVLQVDEATREFKRREFEREIEKRENMLKEILQRYEGERNGIGGIRGTQWAAFNAVTEYADHTKPLRQMGSETERLSRKFESVINGDADKIKQYAYELLTKSDA